jgi:hypothetical protein
MTGRHPRLSAFVPTAAIRDAVEGRENNILSKLGIQGSGKKHIRCPYPDHQDNPILLGAGTQPRGAPIAPAFARTRSST